MKQSKPAKARCASCGAVVETREQWLTERCPAAKQTKRVKNMHLLAATQIGLLKERA